MPTLTFRRVPEPAEATSLWEVTEVQAVQDHQVVGFLRISHIPSARYAERLPGRLAKLAQVLHVSELKLPPAPTLNDYRRALFAGHEWLGTLALANHVSEGVTTVEEARVALTHLEEKLWNSRQAQAKLAAFEAFHVDRPMIDKVDVAGPHQRRGIGRALYVEAANWVAERGLALHASEIQTVAAKAVWAGLTRDGLAQQEGKRACLTGPVPPAPVLDTKPLPSRRRRGP